MTINLENKELLIAMIAGSIVFLILAGFIIYFMFLYRQKQLLHANEQKRLEAQYQEAVMESRMEIQTQILQHVSSEIHDNLGQIASLINIHLHTFPPPENPQAEAKLQESRELLRRLTRDMRQLSQSLNTEHLSEKGFFRALEEESERIARTGIVSVHLNLPAPVPQLDKNIEVFLFRISQEILNNMLKHAQATEIHIDLELQPEHLAISFRDNGIGFNPDLALQEGAARRRSGLRNLQKRCEWIHAGLEIESAPGEGSRFILKLPL
ncbi:MAG: hypothetical protein IBJ09_03610 [Bacteroidia bacterium]|nr:hypothetical protein [Bacteroidia bacterium]